MRTQMSQVLLHPFSAMVYDLFFPLGKSNFFRMAFILLPNEVFEGCGCGLVVLSLSAQSRASFAMALLFPEPASPENKQS